MRHTSTLPTYREALELLDSFSNLERARPSPGFFRGGGERMRRLLMRLGQPHAGIPALHIAGTKGKGSVSRLAEAALRAAGFRTGTYTSPHVLEFRERIAVNGAPIGEHAFAEAAAEVLDEAAAMREEGQAPSYFEILTVIALTAFRQAQVEALILEAGLGGRLDATNLPDLRAVATGLTAISLDHEDLLGDSLSGITAEKAEIIRPQTPVVSAPQAAEVARIIAEKAESLKSPRFAVGAEIKVEICRAPIPDKPALGQRLNLEIGRAAYPDITLAMLGRHQAENAALALGLADLFLEYMDREPLDSLVLKRAWRGFALPARLEMIGQSPWRLVDGAHNPASAWVAAETIGECFTATERTLVFGVAADKDWRTMLRIFAPLFRKVILTSFDSPRSVPPRELAEFLAGEFPGLGTAAAADIRHALTLAEESVSRAGLILVAGSLYLAGEALTLQRRREEAGGK